MAEEEGGIVAQAARGTEAARPSDGKGGEITERSSDLETVPNLGRGNLSATGGSDEAEALLRIHPRGSLLGEDDAVESGTDEQGSLLWKHAPCGKATAAAHSGPIGRRRAALPRAPSAPQPPLRARRVPLVGSLLRSQEFFTLRRAIGRHEQWLVVLAGGRGNRPFRLEAFDPSLLPPPSVPSLVSLHPIRSHFLWGCQLATVGRGRFVLVIGGAVGTDAYHTQNAVWRYDGVTGRWSAAAPMLDARSNFACGTFGRFVVVAGGWDAKREPLRSAEVYDSEKDTWHRLIGLNRRRGQCLGTVFGGKFLVLSGVDRIANNGTTITTTLSCCEAMSLSEDGLERLGLGRRLEES
ncbi:unnamed protein product [Closterium sp. Yama58-4]|nr:unnamed protein product [Closterium sp. Yama58-4]